MIRHEDQVNRFLPTPRLGEGPGTAWLTTIAACPRLGFGQVKTSVSIDLRDGPWAFHREPRGQASMTSTARQNLPGSSPCSAISCG
jgi:hypothetical protein